MSRFKKVFFLFLALGLPIAVFVFLKLFGKNEFAVIPLFQDSVESPAGCNSFTYQTPYTIPDSILTELGWSSSDSIMLVVFDDKIKEKRYLKHSQIQRIQEEFSSEKFSIVCIVENGEAQWLASLPNPVKIYELPHDAFSTFRNCIFLLSESDDAVVIDSKKRIRGQYNLDSMEDGDRLVVHEMNILFNNY
jgi:hypothetical protein